MKIRMILKTLKRGDSSAGYCICTHVISEMFFFQHKVKDIGICIGNVCINNFPKHMQDKRDTIIASRIKQVVNRITNSEIFERELQNLRTQHLRALLLRFNVSGRSKLTLRDQQIESIRNYMKLAKPVYTNFSNPDEEKASSVACRIERVYKNIGNMKGIVLQAQRYFWKSHKAQVALTPDLEAKFKSLTKLIERKYPHLQYAWSIKLGNILENKKFDIKIKNANSNKVDPDKVYKTQYILVGSYDNGEDFELEERYGVFFHSTGYLQDITLRVTASIIAQTDEI